MLFLNVLYFVILPVIDYIVSVKNILLLELPINVIMIAGWNWIIVNNLCTSLMIEWKFYENNIWRWKKCLNPFETNFVPLFWLVNDVASVLRYRYRIAVTQTLFIDTEQELVDLRLKRQLGNNSLPRIRDIANNMAVWLPPRRFSINLSRGLLNRYDSWIYFLKSMNFRRESKRTKSS